MNCLVIVDVQKGFINDYTKHIPDKIVELIQNENFDHIVTTQFINNNASASVKLLNDYSMFDKDETDTCGALGMLAEYNFIKDTYSCFTASFEEYVKDKKIDRLYFVGLNTERCILKSALDAFDRNIDFEVLTNYCATTEGIELHKKGIDVLKSCLMGYGINTEM